MNNSPKSTDTKIKQLHFSPLKESQMAKAKTENDQAITTAIINPDIIIIKYNLANPDAKQMDRAMLAEMLKVNYQMLVNWKKGTTPSVLISIFAMIVWMQETKTVDHMLEAWQPSETPTIVDHIIHMMKIAKCKVEDFITIPNKD